MNNLLAGSDEINGITNPVLEELNRKSGLQFFQGFIPNLIGLALLIGVLVFLFILITGAISWISSGGDKQALEGAKGKVTSALTGLVILLAVFAIVKLIELFFGISILTLDIGNLIIQ